MGKKITLLALASGFLFIACKGPLEHPGQVGNREKLDIYHQQKKVK